MQTQFVTLAIDIADDSLRLRDVIESALSEYGEPLRWAIVAVQGAIAQVEAVVIKDAS